MAECKVTVEYNWLKDNTKQMECVCCKNKINGNAFRLYLIVSGDNGHRVYGGKYTDIFMCQFCNEIINNSK